MPNIASVLKAEITRLARKELREERESLKRALVLQRKEIATLKARLQAMEKAIQRLGKTPKVPHAFSSVPVHVAARAGRDGGGHAARGR